MAKFTRSSDNSPIWVNPSQVFDVAPYTLAADGSSGPTAIVGGGGTLAVVKESAQNVAAALGL